MGMYLEIKNLKVDRKTFEGVHNVLDIDYLGIEKGSTFGLVGESGAGKTVLALTILGLLAMPPGIIRSGEILLNGEDLLKKRPQEMAKLRGSIISMIFQDPMSALNPVFTIKQQMIEVIRTHKHCSVKEAEQEALEMTKTVKLPDPEKILTKYPHELSGGQRQRVIIAMALLCGAELIIADEPTRNLDVTIQAGVLKLIAELQKKFGVTVLFIANNFGLVTAVCDKMAILQDGKIVDRGNAKTLLSTSENAYTKCLIQAVTPQRKEEGHRIFSEETILKVTDLKKYFEVQKAFNTAPKQYVKAVDGLSFEMKKQETLGIVGESGCGKSTLVNTIMLLHKPTAGNVTFADQDVYHLNKKELRIARKDVQIVFQDPFWSLNPRWLVRDIIGEPIKVHLHLNGDAYVEAVQETARMVGLKEDDIYKYPHEFSGGQRQRIAIARALSVHPKLVVLDEPTSAIDVMSQSQILELLEKLRDTMELTYIIISHDLCVVNYMADNILVMYLGKIVEYGPAQVIFDDPKHPYTKALFDAIPGIHTESIEQLSSIKGEVPSAIHPPKGCRFHTRCEHCMDICTEMEPEMKRVDGREVACFLY